MVIGGCPPRLLEDAMTTVALARIDPSVAASLLTVFAVLLVLGTTLASVRIGRLVLEAVWLYLSNTRG